MCEEGPAYRALSFCRGLHPYETRLLHDAVDVGDDSFDDNVGVLRLYSTTHAISSSVDEAMREPIIAIV